MTTLSGQQVLHYTHEDYVALFSTTTRDGAHGSRLRTQGTLVPDPHRYGGNDAVVYAGRIARYLLYVNPGRNGRGQKADKVYEMANFADNPTASLVGVVYP